MMHRTKVAAGLMLVLAGTGCAKAHADSHETHLPTLTAAAPATTDLRAPDVDLDAKDPAQDYVGRYARATHRYGDDSGCPRMERSLPSDHGRSVVVRGRAACGSADTRDVFVVDLAADRLSLDARSNGGPLAAWPDGSLPDHAAPAARSVDVPGDVAASVTEEMRAIGLTPYRVDVYGRGTYRVFAIAGFTEPIAKDSPRERQRAIGKQLCAANGESFAIVGSGARDEITRVRCPSGDTAWEALVAARHAP